MLALASAMLWTFLLVLHWELSGPDTVGLALYAALALVSAVAYLWPGTVFRTASRFAGTSWEDDG